jgi:hypothetical protein
MGTEVGSDGIDSIAGALRAARAAAEFLNSPAAVQAAGAGGAGCGEVLAELAAVRDKLAAAGVTFLRGFDAAAAYHADGHRGSVSWLAERCKMSWPAARAQVRQMRVLAARPALHGALAAGDLSESWAARVAEWTRKLPPEMRAETDKIIAAAAAAGADLAGLATIAGVAVETWRRRQPDPEKEKFDHADRYVATAVTFGGAGVVRGDLSPQCAAVLAAVLEDFGKRRGPEDGRSQGQRQHDALQEALMMALRARLAPGRAGPATRAVVHIPLSDLRRLPGAGGLEEEWLRARLGEECPGYLDGQDAAAAGCDAQTVPVVTGRADWAVLGKLTALAHATCGAGCRAAAFGPGPGAPGPGGTGPGGLSPEAWQAHRYAIARLAIDFVSGPGGLASVLRTGLLDRAFAARSLPLDIGWARSIPPAIRRAVALRAGGHCEWPGCDAPAARCDVHHIVHKENGGETSVRNCVLLCGFHHDICVHRWGWQFTLHPDGTTQARSPDGTQTLHSHAPPLTDTA